MTQAFAWRFLCGGNRETLAACRGNGVRLPCRLTLACARPGRGRRVHSAGLCISNECPLAVGLARLTLVLAGLSQRHTPRGGPGRAPLCLSPCLLCGPFSSSCFTGVADCDFLSPCPRFLAPSGRERAPCGRSVGRSAVVSGLPAVTGAVGGREHTADTVQSEPPS